jgi:hypothetical protein
VGVDICFEAQPVKGCDTESAFAIEDDCGDWIHGLRLLAVTRENILFTFLDFD